MQETWKNSDDKCTFIILHRETFEDKNSNEIEAMIGDTNIFLKEEEGSQLGKSLIEIVNQNHVWLHHSLTKNQIRITNFFVYFLTFF